MVSRAALAVLIVLIAVFPADASATTKDSAARALAADAPGDGYIVVYQASALSVTPDVATDVLERKYGFTSRFRYQHALEGFAARLSSHQAAALRREPAVRLVSPDRRLRAVAESPLAPGDSIPTGVARIGGATSSAVHPASSSAVAVIDSGIDLGHPDLNAVSGRNCIGSGPAQDDNGHGTHVAGTIAAKNNGAGVVGVTPGTTVYAVKSLNSAGSGSDSSVICGIDWVTGNAGALGIKVVNLSLGGFGEYGGCYAEPLHLAICNSTAAGVTYVVAAGNSGWDYGAYPPDVPAYYPEVLTVTAMSDSDGKPGSTSESPGCRPDEYDDSYATFSNYATYSGDVAHTIAAPGVCIRSTYPGGGYSTASGTSMASPHVAGVVALCIGEVGGQRPCAGLTPAQIIQKIRSDAAAHATPDNGFMGDPMHNLGVYFGYLASAAVPTPPPPQAPTASFTVSPNPTSTGQTVTFNASASTDQDGTITNYKWDLDGNGSFETSSGASPTATRSYSAAGTVAVKLRVTDNDGAWNDATRNLTVTSPSNQPPTASFTVSPNPALTNQTVTFNGSASSDPDGTIANYRWDLDGNGSFETDTGTTATTSRTYASPGTVTVKLRVTDNQGATHDATKSLAITSPPNQPPVASFTVSPNPALTNQTVIFNGSASSDPDGTIANYRWDLDGNGSFETDTGTTATTSRSYNAAATVAVKLRVTDSNGATSDATRTLTITSPANEPPNASFSASPNPALTGQTVTFDGWASSDADGTITKYEWDLDGDATLETDTGPTATVSRSYANAGDLTLLLRVTDSAGDTHTAPLVLRVYQAAPPPFPPPFPTPFPAPIQWPAPSAQAPMSSLTCSDADRERMTRLKRSLRRARSSRARAHSATAKRRYRNQIKSLNKRLKRLLKSSACRI
jgi:subtilisin